MKRKSLFLGALALVASAFLAGCSDDDTTVYVPQRVTEFDLAVGPEGSRLFIICPWEGEIAIPVDNDRVGDVELGGTYFDYEIRQGAEGRFLVLNLKQGVERKPFLEKIALRGGAAKSADAPADTLYLVSQPRLDGSASADAPGYMHNIGKTINTTGDIFAAPNEPFLDFNLIYGTEAFVKTPHAESWGRERSGVDYRELVDNMWQEFGVSASNLGFIHQGAPDLSTSKLFSGSLEERFQHNRTSSNRFEYHVDIHVKPMVELHLATAIYTADTNPDLFLPFLTTTASRLLNDPGSDLYKRYDNSKEGIYKLYDTYGTHVLVGGVFGGSYTYVYSRKENYYYDETVVAAEVDLSVKAEAQPGAGENWLQTYYRVMGTHGGKIGAGGGSTKSELNEHMSEESIMIITGGNASMDFESWDQSIADENSNLHLVSYAPRGDTTKCFLVPLYFLTKNQPRRDALMEHLNAYVDDHSKLADKPKLVVADFMMLRAKNGYQEQPEQRVMVGPDGMTKRIYTPLVANSKAPGDERKGCMLETSSANYIAVSDATDQLWWVALDFVDECDPITNIRFLDSDAARSAGYTIRGDNADSGMNWSAIDNHYVSLKFAEEADREAGRVITGVGVARESGDQYSVIASSPGTDMLMPYTLTQTQFERFWGTTNYRAGDQKPYILGAGDPYRPNKYDSWFGDHLAGHNGEWILPVFVYEALDRPLKAQKAQNW
ncbi:MAC/perforin domain-containing protein [Parabacteroides sp. ZJ-118]|uniref:MAC/perforin domain-containing protein n=1 Tax=Parabacteroides sp. ZJ-118 TaxID=2709398 RepID=UPI0013EB9EA6|nr:MAC/perforin domain-containing protein [Parabacteroides sp. ZJ-118]